MNFLQYKTLGHRMKLIVIDQTSNHNEKRLVTNVARFSKITDFDLGNPYE